MNRTTRSAAVLAMTGCLILGSAGLASAGEKAPAEEAPAENCLVATVTGALADPVGTLGAVAADPAGAIGGIVVCVLTTAGLA
ncbi:MAG: hypothetical protein ACR2GH_07860 [Pseudonocardia sp.]